MPIRSIRIICALVPLFASAAPAVAQWSSDPAVNLTLADRKGGQAQPKIAADADGGFYVSWFGNGGDGFDVYLQHVDAAGVESWTHDGVLVADRSESSTQDYGLAVDADGSALLAYQYEDSQGVAQIGASRFDASGASVWGDPVFVSNDGNGANSPRIAATPDGGAVVAWSGSDGSIQLQKLDGATGALGWGAGIFTGGSGFFLLADIQAAPDGSVIVAWSAQRSALDREYWAQKFTNEGVIAWQATPLKVFDGDGGAMQFGYFPPFIADGEGGAVFVWYTVNIAGTVHAQHVHADGSFAFAQNGVGVTTDSASTHTEPAGAYDTVSGDIYAIWRVADASTQSQIGINAQRIDSSGALRYGDTGIVLAAQSATDQSEVTALALPGGGALFSWASGDYPDAMPVHVSRRDADGDAVWSAGTVDIKTGASDTARVGAGLSTQPFAAYVWEDATGGGGGGSIKIQNIDFDGVLGPAAAPDLIFADGFDPRVP